jgi:hypothetical protein
LEKQLEERYGIECNRQTMARWTIALMEPLRPIFNLMKDEVISYDVSSCDATTLQVLREPVKHFIRLNGLLKSKDLTGKLAMNCDKKKQNPF